MKKRIVAYCVLVLSSAVLIFSAPNGASAQGNIPGMVAQRCAAEITEFCKDVLPGVGRITACLYAHSNNISYDCAYTMYDASEQLNSIRSALDLMAQKTSCRSDIKQYCIGVAPGAGRIYNCIKKNRATLTNGCRAILPKAEALLSRAGLIGN